MIQNLLKSLHHFSIAKRLCIMYTAAAAIVLSVIVIALYIVEMKEIDSYQTAEMKNRFSLIEHTISERSSLANWKQTTNRLEEITPKDSSIYIRVDSENPNYRFNAPFQINQKKILKHHGFARTSINGRTFRTLSKMIPARGERPDIILSIAIDTYFYDDDLWLDFIFAVFLILGISASATLGWFIAKRSLAPVDMLSHYAEKISPQNLSDRLPNTDLPSELEGLVFSFNGALERLEESYLRQSTFNSDVAHELRTPLGNLIGATEVALSRPRSKEELEDVMQSNLEELERLRTIINDMLFLSRADQGELAINLIPVSLSDIVRKTAEFLDVIMEENNSTLEISGEAVALAESSLLSRAITNLLDNAINHGLKDHPIKVEISKDSHYAILSISNFSPPIEDNHLKNIFNRFYRVSQNRQNSGNNHHGLGLAIVKAIALMHNGKVFAKFQDGLFKVQLTIPLA